MASISRIGLICHLRSEPNQFILHYRNGKLVRQGAGLSYWFSRLSAAIAQVPVEDCETTFMLNERTSDFQEVSVQCTLTYRISNPQQAAARVNFTVSLESGVWTERPLERLANLWSQVAQKPARAYLTTVPVVEAIGSGAERIQEAISQSLSADEELKGMGLAVVNAQVIQVTPTAELEKAVQTPTREAIQQKADEAVFQRRALAVEKERAIKENELATEIELARRQEELIQRQGANRLLEARQEAEAEQLKQESRLERERLEAESDARVQEIRSLAEAAAKKRLAEAEADGEAKRVEVWREAPQKVILGLALQHAATKLENIQHLNLTPDLVAQALTQFGRDQA